MAASLPLYIFTATNSVFSIQSDKYFGRTSFVFWKFRKLLDVSASLPLYIFRGTHFLFSIESDKYFVKTVFVFCKFLEIITRKSTALGRVFPMERFKKEKKNRLNFFGGDHSPNLPYKLKSFF